MSGNLSMTGPPRFSVKERRPFCGNGWNCFQCSWTSCRHSPGHAGTQAIRRLSPAQQNVGILNGMGTKGCSLAPFFANQLFSIWASGWRSTLKPMWTGSLKFSEDLLNRPRKPHYFCLIIFSILYFCKDKVSAAVEACSIHSYFML